jgi:hypothetical protein
LTSVCDVQALSQVFPISSNVLVAEILSANAATPQVYYNRECLRNWEEVCGAASCMPRWLCPGPNPRLEDGFAYQGTLYW